MTAPLTESYWPADTSAPVRDVTVTALLRHAAETVPERIALVDAVAAPRERRTWTYAEYLHDVEGVARRLLERFAPGERVAIWAPNSADWVIVQQALLIAGLVAVPVNPAYRAQELAYILGQSGAAGLVHTSTYRGHDQGTVIRELATHGVDLSSLRHVLTLGSVTTGEAPASGEFPEVPPEQPIQIQYTSGTTGAPKGALLHQKGLVNAADLVAERAGLVDGGSYVNAMPMYHIGGGAVLSFGAVARRGTFIVLPGFDAGLMLECIETYGGTHTLVVPTMLLALLDHPDRATRA